jgi:hypothetical protein
VNRLLSEICTIHTISFEPATLSLNWCAWITNSHASSSTCST